MNKDIEVIIFDIGGVLVNEVFYDFLQRVLIGSGADFEEVRQFIRPIFHEEVMTGRITETQMWQRVIDRYHLGDNASALQTEMGKEVIKIERVWEFVDQLHGKYRLAILSNLGLDSIPHREEFLSLSKHFEIIVYSALAGLKKPDPEFFRHILDLLKVSAKNCLFIDDKERNIEAAKQLGMIGIVFTNPNQLKEDLVKNDVFVV